MALTDVNHEQYFHEIASFTDAFQYQAEQYENGEKSAADVWLEMKSEIDALQAQIDIREAWKKENQTAIADEFEKYGKAGYKGYTATIQNRTTMNYKNIPAWQDAEQMKKEVEAKAKLAYQFRQKGMEPIDANTGELLPEPEVTVTSFLKTEKVK